VVEEVRGSGMLLGLKCVVPSGDLQTRLREEHGMLTVGAAENVLRLLPPLTIEEAHVDEAVKAVDAACAGLARDAA
jgi:acetylornithine/N-succinyldiaminopimelate aminotransferase